MKHIYTIAIYCLLCTYSSLLSAQRIYVTSTGTGNGSSWAQAGNLSTILTNAFAGAEIWVAAGTYYPTDCTTCSSSDQNVYFEIPDDVALYGGFAGTETQLSQRDWSTNQTILSGDIDKDGTLANNSYTIIYTHNVSADAIVDGFIIQYGNAIDLSVPFGSPANTGGGWYNDGSQSGTISNPTIRNCIFRWNEAIGFGGGMYNDGCFSGEGNPLLVNCMFWQNRSKEGGGGMYNNGSFSGDCSPHYFNCEFTDNFSENSGGGLFNNGLKGNSEPIITNTLFYENRVDLYGGGIYNLGNEGNSSPKLTNCIFYGNIAYAAGGIYNIGSKFGNSSPTITNCTFYANVAEIGACVYNQAVDTTGNADPIVSNSIFWGNTANTGFGYVFQNVYGEPTISYSLVQVNNCSELNTGLNGGAICGSNIIYNVDPLMVDPANKDFRLTSNSPIIDGGSNAAINATGISLDLDSLARIVNGTVDLGAYEYVNNQYIAPSISSQPQAQTVCEGTAVSFTVEVAGSRPLSYQWQKNNVDIQGATDSVFNIPNTVLSDIGNYRCSVTSSQMDVVNSAAAALQVDELLTVAIAIEASADAICAGDQLTFTALPTNGGTQAQYQWRINNNLVGSNSSTFLVNTLQSADVVSCSLISSENCTINNSASSNNISVNVQPLLAASIDISASATEICAGETISFSSTITNGGSSPEYRWLVNGQASGNNQSVFSTTTLADGDIVTCELLSSEQCLIADKVNSNAIPIAINPQLVPGINISASSMDICSGGSVTFTAIPTNGGNTPFYQWRVNSTNVGTNSSSFNTDQLQNSDIVTCILSSSETCLLTNDIVSNVVAVNVNNNLVAAIEIDTETAQICAGDEVRVTAIPTNGGLSPSFKWYLNGNLEATGMDTYISDQLLDGDQLTCEMTSSMDCVIEPIVNSAPLNFIVGEQLSVAVQIMAEQDSVCFGEPMTFVATATNGGSNPSYQWLLNGNSVGGNETSYTSSNLRNEDDIQCQLVSSSSCTIQDTVLSTSVRAKITPIIKAGISIESSDSILCVGDSVSFFANTYNGGAAPTFQWQVNGMDVASNDSIFITNTLIDGDEISCIFRSSLPCPLEESITSNIILAIVDNCMVATNELLDSFTYRMYPNPSNGLFTIELQRAVGEFTVEIINLQGVVVYQQYLQPYGTSTAQEVNLSGLAAGVYFVKINNSKAAITKQLFIQNKRL